LHPPYRCCKPYRKVSGFRLLPWSFSALRYTITFSFWQQLLFSWQSSL
jgi:hypothetical protein